LTTFSIIQLPLRQGVLERSPEIWTFAETIAVLAASLAEVVARTAIIKIMSTTYSSRARDGIISLHLPVSISSTAD
jgi:hypothetical protein